MLNINYKKEAISFLDKKFNNYIQMSDICRLCGNDPELVITVISKIIKCAFLNPKLIDDKAFMNDLIQEIPNIDEEYANNLPRKKGFRFGKKVKFVVPYTLDYDIDPEDLLDLRLPTLEYIKMVCRDNIFQEQLNKEQDRKRKEKIAQLVGFSATAFNYETEDLVIIDEDFEYDGLKLTGDVINDFRSLYAGERYQTVNNPLNRNYYDNLEDILAFNDIRLSKVGKLYYIYNGRHRILYLKAREQPVAIRAYVNKRIENERINELLIDLRNKISYSVFKDNPYSDDEIICIVYDSKLFVIHDEAELERFCESYDIYPASMYYIDTPLNRDDTKLWEINIKEYCDLYGINILDISFSQLVTKMGATPSANLYQAYLNVCFAKNREIVISQINEFNKENLYR